MQICNSHAKYNNPSLVFTNLRYKNLSPLFSLTLKASTWTTSPFEEEIKTTIGALFGDAVDHIKIVL